MERAKLYTSVSLSLPEWVRDWEVNLDKKYPTDEDKMRLAVELSAKNVEESSGGPFGAAIFNSDTGEVISIGVNRVVPLFNSTAHAEMMAFMLAQHRLRNHRLNASRHHFVMATSAQPCAMCYGASVWAGINRILIGARREDVESLTEFDEGPMPRNWIQGLKRRGISVDRDILRKEASEVLREYARQTGQTY
ncbi:nucleoside deaminase [Puniceicoccales bacterium CK1056]|uniref:Nucleoside deaminase n=1 Tax=Oceanipulchritudo coccoides TaxID=2706888 RepID=A0A6B2M2M7_9BACT|nr:nucleoside deaminase [Oceanipulchritudo coccoides]NDV63271.1 nucleoside deaminase [Oceanipulchritudo coccoides]